MPCGDFEPIYRASARMGRLAASTREARQRLRRCELCPRRCGVDRLAGERGFCRTGRRARIASVGPHFGEEPPLAGTGGSGTIFFSECHLRCIFCQNWEISQEGEGEDSGLAELAGWMLALERRGCHNVNLVTPSHVVPQILGALCLAEKRGLSVPLVYNTSGYDAVETLRLLEGAVDIYMPDLKWAGRGAGERLARAPDYWDVAREAVREMYRQVGDLVLDARGVATRGLLVRHLVLPEGLAGTPRVMEFLAREISPDTYVNVMAQYHPAGESRRDPDLNRRITRREYAEAVEVARRAGLRRIEGAC